VHCAAVSTSTGRFGREENDSIRFDSMKLFLFVRFCVNPFASPYRLASLTIAIILFVVSVFVVHINRMLNAVFFVQENFSNVVYNKICNYVSKKVIFLKCNKRTYTVAMSLEKCSAYNRKN